MFWLMRRLGGSAVDGDWERKGLIKAVVRCQM
jgi:hypothetical protein